MHKVTNDDMTTEITDDDSSKQEIWESYDKYMNY